MSSEHRPAGHEPDQPDERLRELVARVDPAASLPPATPREVARLLEETMTDAPDARHSGTDRRGGPMGWVAAAAVAAVIGAVAFFATTGDDPAPTAQEPGASATPDPTTVPSPTETAEPGSVTELEIRDPGTAKCLMPNVEVLRGQEIAFDGVVTSIEGDTVTLEPTTWFRGTPTETVEVTAPPKELRMVLVAVDFKEGERYLVSTFGGEVTLCGFSDAWNPELAELYSEAYAQG